MPENTSPKPVTIAVAVLTPMLMLLVGAGCMRFGEKLANDAVAPIELSADAMRKAKEVTEQENAKQREQADMTSDDITVAMIVTENADVPAGGEIGPTIGCNDRAVFMRIHRGSATDSVVHDALMTLFAIKDTHFQGAYNALNASSLTVEKIQSRDGVTTEVWIKGKVVSGGSCDDPRIKAQIEETVRRFKPKFKIFLNGSESEYKCLGDQSGECQ